MDFKAEKPQDSKPGEDGTKKPGKVRLFIEEVFGDLIPNALKTDGKEKAENAVPFLQLFKYSDALDKFLIIVGVISSVVSGALFPLMFSLYGEIAQNFIEYQSNKTSFPNAPIDTATLDTNIYGTLYIFLALGIITLIMNYLCNYCMNMSAERQIKRIRLALFDSILRQDMSFFDKNKPGELNSIMSSNLETLRNAINYSLTNFIKQMTVGLACLVFGVVACIQYSLVFLVFIPFMVVTIYMMIHYLKKFSIAEFMSYGIAGNVAQETLSSLRTVVSLGLQDKVIQSYSDKLDMAKDVGIKKGKYKGIALGAFWTLFSVMAGVGIFYQIYLFNLDNIKYSIKVLIPVFSCLNACSFTLGIAITFFSDIATAKATAKKIFDKIATESAIDIKKSSSKTIDKIKGNIRFQDVTFNYPSRPDVQILKGINLNIPAGRTVAFCGPSGCGKSTMIALLQRFYLPQAGSIELDGERIDELNLSWLRNQMALVSQEPSLFTTTIRENIRLGRLDATDQDIEDAAKHANAHEFIMGLKDKYDTKVGERGAALSGGQKQRIAIARALIRNPKILLLDEATSALDNESERAVQDALDRAKIGRTTLIIAHRLTTIRSADLIVGIKDGVVQEQGTHRELMDIQGIYSDLVERQTLKKKDFARQRTVSIKSTCSIGLEEDSSSDESDSDDEVERKENTLGSKMNAESGKKRKAIFRNPFKLEMKLWKLQAPEKWWIILGVFGQLLNGIIFPGIAIVITELYAIYADPEPEARIKSALNMMLGFLGLALVYFVIVFAYNYGLGYAGSMLTKRIRIKMFESMLRQEIGYHDEEANRSSVLATQLSMTPPQCVGLTSDKLGILAQGLSGTGFSIIFAFTINWKMSIVMLVFVPITFYSGVFVARMNAGSLKLKGKYAAEEGGRLLIESVDNIKSIVSLGRESHFLDEMQNLFGKGTRRIQPTLNLQAFFYTVSNTMTSFIQIVAFAYGWSLIKQDELQVDELYRIYFSMTFSSLILGAVYAQLPDQKKARNATKIAFKVLERTPKIDSMSNEGLKPEKLTGNIEFKSVKFEYPTSPEITVLSDFNMQIKNGQTIAFVGHSGCGKSTTISLLLRFYDVTGGSIELDGVDIRELNIKWLRSQIALVSQEPVLFDCSIKENISDGDLTRSDISLEEIIKATTDSNIRSRIERLPQSYDTVVGLRGSQLSGGEKQRVAIARALIRKPKILLLDEATSALDTQSEQIVQDALDKAQRGRTCIVIAHRLSTIENSDRICVLSRGHIVEQGTHSELIMEKLFYYSLQFPSNKTRLEYF